MSGHSAENQKAANSNESSKEKAVYNELVRWFGSFYQYDLDEVAFGALDTILDLRENDRFYCEATCLGYIAHVLSLENGPKELWIILDNDGEYAFPAGEDEQYVEDMTERGRASAQAIGEISPIFKGFANVPPDGPYKLLISVEYDTGAPDALCWAEMNSFFYHRLDVETSKAALIYPFLEAQPEGQSLREGLLTGGLASWAVEPARGRVIIGVGGGNGNCRMVDLSDREDPWEMELSPFEIAACGGCMVPSMCRRCADSIGKTTLGELSVRISRGTSLGRKALKPRTALEAHRGKPLLVAGDNGLPAVPSNWLYDNRYGFRVSESDYLFLDSSCINADHIEPLFIGEIPKGQERYTVYPHDGVVLLVSRNEKRFILYEAVRPTLIANSVYIVWPSSNVDTQYLECWLEGSFAEWWLRTAGKTSVGSLNSDPILSKGTLSSLPVPILEDGIASQTVARKQSIQHRIQELYSEISMLESKEPFAPASAMAKPDEFMDEC